MTRLFSFKSHLGHTIRVSGLGGTDITVCCFCFFAPSFFWSILHQVVTINTVTAGPNANAAIKITNTKSISMSVYHEREP